MALINSVIEMGADLSATMNEEMSTMHCAAQTYHGLLSILILSKRFNISVN
jgi:hypothetical protein